MKREWGSFSLGTFLDRFEFGSFKEESSVNRLESQQRETKFNINDKMLFCFFVKETAVWDSACSSYSQYKLPKTKIVKFCVCFIMRNIIQFIVVMLEKQNPQSCRAWVNISWTCLWCCKVMAVVESLQLRKFRISITSGFGSQNPIQGHFNFSRSGRIIIWKCAIVTCVLEKMYWAGGCESFEDDDECFSLKNA